MLTQWIRVLTKQASLIDRSIASQNEEGFAANFSTTEYLYIGQHYAFNNFFLEMGTVNAVVSNLSVDYWDGRAWRAAVDILDGTSLAGATLGRTGVVQFSPDTNFSWTRINDTSDEDATFGLESLNIYNMFWLRVKVSVNLTAGTNIKHLSYAFTNDRMLKSIDPEIDQYLSAWGGAGKLNWVEQIRLGSQHVIMDLKARSLVSSNAQILRFDDVSLAAAYRTLLQIYAPFGEGFKDKRAWAQAQYTSSMDVKNFSFDRNNDAELSMPELNQTTGKLVR